MLWDTFEHCPIPSEIVLEHGNFPVPFLSARHLKASRLVINEQEVSPDKWGIDHSLILHLYNYDEIPAESNIYLEYKIRKNIFAIVAVCASSLVACASLGLNFLQFYQDSIRSDIPDQVVCLRYVKYYPESQLMKATMSLEVKSEDIERNYDLYYAFRVRQPEVNPREAHYDNLNGPIDYGPIIEATYKVPNSVVERIDDEDITFQIVFIQIRKNVNIVTDRVSDHEQFVPAKYGNDVIVLSAPYGSEL